MSAPLSRRHILKGAGAAVALPFLASLQSRRAQAATDASWRFVAILLPNPLLDKFGPAGTNDLRLEGRYAPLARHSSRLLHVTGMENTIAGGYVAHGLHDVAIAGWSTARPPLRGDGDGLWVGRSIDQIVAQAWKGSPIDSLALGTDEPNPGACFPNWPCAYRFHMSWSSPTTPVPKLNTPAALFDRLFTRSAFEASVIRSQRRSVLDFVRDEAKRLSSKLDGADRGRMEEYLESVRQIERRVDRTLPAIPAGVGRPSPGSFHDDMRSLMDLAVLALRLGETRVLSLLWGYSGHLLVYNWLGATKDHHGHAHEPDAPGTRDLLTRIESYRYEQVAYFLDALKQTPIDGGTLADRTCVVVGHEHGDALAHTHTDHHVFVHVPRDLPLKTGVRVNVPDERLGNFHLTLLRALGLPDRSFGVSGRSLISAIRT